MYVLLLGLVVFLSDQFSKYLVITGMKPFESVPVLENIFHLTYLQNTGGAFSLLRGRTTFFTVFTTIIIFIILYSLFRYALDKRIKLLLAMILGGALGNLVDRIRFGYVVDFIDFRVWPVFNIADCAIVVGVVILSVLIAFHEEPERLLGDNRG